MKDRKRRQQILKTYQDFADIHPFELRASELAGRIRLDYHLDEGLPEKDSDERQTLTVDMMIAAVAIVNGASHIITDDVDDFEAITADYDIEVFSIAEPPPGQGDLDFSEG